MGALSCPGIEMTERKIVFFVFFFLLVKGISLLRARVVSEVEEIKMKEMRLFVLKRTC